MTNENAIKQLKMLKEHLKNDMYADDQNAINAALKALEKSENGMSAKDVHFLLEDIKAEIRKGLDIIGTNKDYEQGYNNAIKRALTIIDKHIGG